MDDPNPETGDNVTITVIPDEGKVVDKVTVKDANGQEIPVTDNGDGSYTYEQPAGDVTIEVTFKDKPHEHSYTDVVTKPTCTERGYTTYTRECGDSYVAGYVAPTGHSFTRYHSDRNATCKRDGTETARCDHRCGATHTRRDRGSRLGHNYVDG